MRANFLFAGRGFSGRRCRMASCTAVGLLLLLSPLLAAAQQTPSGAIGRIRGTDISLNGMPASDAASPAAYVSSGDAVTVHSGQAVLQLADGSELSICGPAKFTVLESGDAVTIALEFGRVHALTPATTALRIFTPSIVATPVDAGGDMRELTVGLDQKNSLCVIAAAGAVRLEQQFSGESLIIPQAGDFTVAGDRLAPVAETGASCQCAAPPVAQPGGRVPPPETAMAPAAEAPASDAAPVPPAAANDSREEFGALSLASATRPLPAPAKPAAGEAPPVSETVDQIALPPMMFSAASPKAPEAPTAETALLIREIRVDPEWEFTGRVEPPGLARPVKPAPVENGGGAAQTQRAPSDTRAKKKSGGLWSALLHVFHW